eukprot:364360-Chlamydomonas_euryale.AAC.3
MTIGGATVTHTACQAVIPPSSSSSSSGASAPCTRLGCGRPTEVPAAVVIHSKLHSTSGVRRPTWASCSWFSVSGVLGGVSCLLFAARAARGSTSCRAGLAQTSVAGCSWPAASRTGPPPADARCAVP